MSDLGDTSVAVGGEGGSAALRWGRTPPSVPGWYWIRPDVRRQAAKVEEYDGTYKRVPIVSMVRVEWTRTNESVSDFLHILGVAGAGFLPSALGAEWAGPIPEPLEPEAV